MCAGRKSIAVAALVLGLLASSVRAQLSQYQWQRDLSTAPNRSTQNTVELNPRRQPAEDVTLSARATDYLHRHRLPLVAARVFRDVSGAPASVVLSGQVRTEFGKNDAERKVEKALATTVRFGNQIVVEPNLSATVVAQSGSSATIPEAFFGCWQGSVSHGHYGSINPGCEYLGGCPRGFEIPSTSEMCIAKTPTGGFEITSQSASAPLPNFRSHTDLTSSDGNTHIDFVTSTSYDINGGDLFGLSSSHVTATGPPVATY